MNKIEFNTPEGSQRRQAQKPLTLEQEVLAIKYINLLLEAWEATNPPAGATQPIIDGIQPLIDHYQNLCHYKARTVGMWAVEDEDDIVLGSNKVKLEF